MGSEGPGSFSVYGRRDVSRNITGVWKETHRKEQARVLGERKGTSKGKEAGKEMGSIHG